MTTCHSLKLVSDEIIGDPLDAKMFEFTGWTFEEGGRVYEVIPDDQEGDDDKETHGRYVAREGSERSGMALVRPPASEGKVFSRSANQTLELQLMRIFEFESSKRRMSVIVRKSGTKHLQVYVKGAPEIMSDICQSPTCTSLSSLI
jgi:cation-transporting P-type ATPase 13A2